MRVDVEKLKQILAERAAVNSVPLAEIEWYEDGKKIEFDPEVIEDFRFTGLNNTDFYQIVITGERGLTIMTF